MRGEGFRLVMLLKEEHRTYNKDKHALWQIFWQQEKITRQLKHNRNLRIHQMQLIAIKSRTYSGDESGETETVLLS